MEPVPGTKKTSKSAPEEKDVIIRMPDTVITYILDCLPIRDAVRTSILSRRWRFKWTMLTQLVFNHEFFAHLPRQENYDWRIIITRLFIHLKGPITKFNLVIPDDLELDVDDINHWVMFLSRKGIKDILIIHNPQTLLKLPTHLFSCLELTHLDLDNCSFQTPPSFHGFPNLLSLKLCEVTDYGNSVQFFTKCPLLEILLIMSFKFTGKVSLVEIAKLKNLKELSLSLTMLDSVAITSFTVIQCVGTLPKLQELCLDFTGCKFIKEAGVRKWVCTTFPCLKTLVILRLDFGNDIMLSCAFELILGSPNLQTLEISATLDEVDVQPPAFSFPEVYNSTKLQLQTVEFSCCRGSENELFLIETLLACSPLLQSMKIFARSSSMIGGYNGKLGFATKLLELNRASPVAKIKLRWFYA